MTGKKTWPYATPKQWAEAPMATQLCLAAFRAQNVDFVVNAWQNLMAKPGWILRRKGAPKATYCYVLRVCMYGVLCWPMLASRLVQDGPKHFEFQPDGNLLYENIAEFTGMVSDPCQSCVTADSGP